MCDSVTDNDWIWRYAVECANIRYGNAVEKQHTLGDRQEREKRLRGGVDA